MSDYDSPWKEALDAYFEAFVAFFFPQTHAAIDWSRGYEVLDKELQQVVREAELGQRVVDKLVKVWLKGGAEAWVLIHVEVQSQEETGFPRRMYVYNYRLFDRYNREVARLAVLGDDRPNWRPGRFGYTLFGCRVGIEYPVVKLLDYLPHLDALEAQPNPFALLVAAHLRTQQTRGDPAARRRWKVRLVRSLYERGLTAEDVRRLFRFIDWVMDLPPELEDEVWQEVERLEKEKSMPYVTTVERRALERGRQEGLLEGRLEESHRLLLRQGRHRLGEPDVASEAALRAIRDLERLGRLADAVLSAGSWQELLATP